MPEPRATNDWKTFLSRLGIGCSTLLLSASIIGLLVMRTDITVANQILKNQDVRLATAEAELQDNRAVITAMREDVREIKTILRSMERRQADDELSRKGP